MAVNNREGEGAVGLGFWIEFFLHLTFLALKTLVWKGGTAAEATDTVRALPSMNLGRALGGGGS